MSAAKPVQNWRVLLGGPIVVEGPSELSYAETIRAVALLDRYTGRAREIHAEIHAASPDHLGLYLTQAASLASLIQALPPKSPAPDPDTTYKYLSGAVVACCRYLEDLAGLRAELNTVADETALLGLIQRAKDLSHEVESAAIAGARPGRLRDDQGDRVMKRYVDDPNPAPGVDRHMDDDGRV